MFLPAVYSWFPVGTRTPTALILHDAIAEHLPQLVCSGSNGPVLLVAEMRLACRKRVPNHPVSQAAKREIVEFIGIRPERIEVICEGAGPNFAPVDAAESRAAARRAPASLRMTVCCSTWGGLAPHKNLLTLLAGLQTLHRTCRTFALRLSATQPATGSTRTSRK